MSLNIFKQTSEQTKLVYTGQTRQLVNCMLLKLLWRKLLHDNNYNTININTLVIITCNVLKVENVALSARKPRTKSIKKQLEMRLFCCCIWCIELTENVVMDNYSYIRNGSWKMPVRKISTQLSGLDGKCRYRNFAVQWCDQKMSVWKIPVQVVWSVNTSTLQ